MIKLWIACAFLLLPTLARAESRECGAAFRETSSVRLQSVLDKVPQRDAPWTMETYRSFQKQVGTIFQTNEAVHDFLWAYAQDIPRVRRAFEMATSDVFRNGEIQADLANAAKTRLELLSRLLSLELQIFVHFGEADRVPAILNTNLDLKNLAIGMDLQDFKQLVSIHEKWAKDLEKPQFDKHVFDYFQTEIARSAYVPFILEVQKKRNLNVFTPDTLTDRN